MPKPFVIIGSANVDFIMKVPHLPARGETVTDGTFLQTYGGKGANQAVAAARAGAATHFIACVGEDAFGREMAANFLQDSIGLAGLMRSIDQPSGSALVMIEEGGMNYLTVAPGANHALSPTHVEAHARMIASAGLILLQMEVSLETNLAAIAIARGAGVPVILNYAPAHLISQDLLRGVDILIVNENEAAELCGINPIDPTTAEAAARALASMGPARVLVTLGSQGCLIFDGGMATHVPAFRVAAVDTTAAGDTFCGTLGTALLEGHDLPAAARFASAASALSVTRFGAQPSIPPRITIDDFLQSH